MKHFFKLTILASVVAALIFGLSAFTPVKKVNANIDSYQISLVDKATDGTNETWTWSLVNPNPGNGNNGTLQNVSHFDIALSANAEAALVSAEYSFDGITWISVPTEIVRDPSIRQCTTTDVLKFNAGTVGSQPTYYRATFGETFDNNPYATSWINSGSRTGCNMYYFTGVGGPKLF
ncbi:MAG TPA: hypothetical protein VKB95_03880 [Chitinophagaceae bacterium]|nr:hypothetical protein [Chitinophagaceae bacterium]